MSGPEDSETITDPSTLIWKQRIALGKSFFNTFGLPILILVYLAWGIRCIVIFCAPYAIEAATQHVTTLRQMGDSAVQIAEQNKEIGKTQESIAKSIESTARSIDAQQQNGKEFIEISKSMAKQLQDVHQAVVKGKDAKD